MSLVKPRNKTVRALGVDPGNNEMGVSILELSTDNSITTLFADTLKPSPIKDELLLTEILGKRYMRQVSLLHQLTDIVDQYQPYVVGYENPFVGNKPNAHEALVELRTNFRMWFYQRYPSLPIFYFSPTHIKKMIGVKTIKDRSVDRKNKPFVAEALKRSKIITDDTLFESCGPDGRDAIAVAASVLMKIENYDIDLLI
jgi:Holliday junction resolvasome RuvABC endonuclease subunit